MGNGTALFTSVVPFCIVVRAVAERRPHSPFPRPTPGLSMLAYVFWHWRQPQADAGAYETSQRRFHDVLAAEPSAGFRGSFSHALSGAPWANAGGDAYEDWYLVDGSASLDPLNHAAVTAARQAPHDAAAAHAAGGTAGLYRLRIGTLEASPTIAYWFDKPAGMPYPEFL